MWVKFGVLSVAIIVWGFWGGGVFSSVEVCLKGLVCGFVFGWIMCICRD